MMWRDFDRNKQTTETCARNEKKYCSCCIILIRIDTILLKTIQNYFQNLLFRKMLAQSGDQLYFRNFTRLQTHFGRPKPSGECQVTPLYMFLMKTTFKSEDPKKLIYRDYSNFSCECFNDDFMSSICQEKHDYSDFQKRFIDTLTIQNHTFQINILFENRKLH